MNTLVRLGTAVRFQRESGVEFAVRGAMLYDDTGKAWPRGSILISSFEKLGTVADDPTAFAKRWSSSEWREGRITLPPRELSGWSDGEPVVKIEYVRMPEDELLAEHEFGRLGSFLGKLIPVRFGKMPLLYRRAGMARLEPVTVTRGGIVAP